MSTEQTTQEVPNQSNPPVYKTLKELDEAPEIPEAAEQQEENLTKPVDLTEVPPTTNEESKETSENEESKEETEDEESSEPELDVDGFFAQVEQITGEPVKVDYGDADPLSAEGVAIREKAVREDAAVKFEEYLRDTNPRGYAYLLHKQSGGSDEDFFAQKTITLPDAETFKNSTDAKVALLEKDLIDNGVPEDIAKASVTKFIKDNTLDERADKVYTKIKQAEANQLADIEQREQQQRQAFETAVNTITSNISKTINEGNLKFIVPEASRAAFDKYIKSNIRYDNGQFHLVSTLGEDMKEVLEAEYFKFVKGDLSKLIEKKAKTLTVQKLKASVKQSSNTKLNSTDGSKRPKGYIPLGEL